LAWWLPQAALVAGVLVVVPARTVIWIVALAWMGVACILNARRCGRTHCRFTGPYYLSMIIPVLSLGLGVVRVGLFGWLVLGAFIILGSKTWWATARAGKVLVTYEMGGSRTGPVAVCGEAIVSPGSEPLTDEVRPAGFAAKKCHHAC
jgi:hypothetical protein